MFLYSPFTEQKQSHGGLVTYPSSYCKCCSKDPASFPLEQSVFSKEGRRKMWRLRASPRLSQAWLLSPGLFPASLLAAVLFCCVFMYISSGLSYLKFIQLIDFVDFMPLPILKHFQPFFLFKNIFQSHTLSPSGTAMIQILGLLLLSHRSLRLCSFIFFQSIFSPLFRFSKSC